VIWTWVVVGLIAAFASPFLLKIWNYAMQLNDLRFYAAGALILIYGVGLLLSLPSAFLKL
jgi:hypothetical protein